MRLFIVLAFFCPSLVAAQLPENALYRIGGAPFQSSGEIQHSTMSPDGKRFAASSRDRITVWDASGKVVQTIEFRAFSELLTASYLAISPDNRLLALITDATVLELFDISAGKCLGKMPNRKPTRYRSCVFTPDGGTLLGFGRDGIDVWEVAERKHLSRIDIAGLAPVDRTELAPILPSANGKVCASPNGEVFEIRSLPEGKKIREIPHGADRKYFRLDPSGTYLLVSGSDAAKQLGTGQGRAFPLSVYEVATGRLLRELSIPTQGGPGPATMTADGKRIVVISYGGDLSTWDSESGRLLSKTSSLGGMPKEIHLPPDGESVLIARENRLVRSHIEKGESEEEKSRWKSWLLSRLSPDGKRLALSDGFGKFELWDAEKGKRLHALSSGVSQRIFPPPEYRAIQFSADGSRLFGRTYMLRTESWNPKTGTPKPEETIVSRSTEGLPVDIFCLGSIDFSPRSERLVMAAPMDMIHLVSAKTKKELWQGEKSGFFTAVAWTPEERAILHLNRNAPESPLLSWVDPRNGKTVSTLGLTVDPLHAGRNRVKSALGHGDLSIAVRADSRLAAVTVGDDTIRLIDLRSYRQINSIECPGWRHVNAVAFSPDGRWLVFGGDPGNVGVVEVASRELAMRFSGHEAPVFNVGFFPDGKRIYSSGLDCTCLVWNASKAPGTNQTLDRAWFDLKLPAEAAYAARSVFLSREKDAITWFEGKLRPLEPIDAERLARWFRDLDSDSFGVRENAARELSKLPRRVAPKLEAELRKEPSETKRESLSKLLEATYFFGKLKGDELLRDRVDEILSRFDSKEAKELRAKLAGMK